MGLFNIKPKLRRLLKVKMVFAEPRVKLNLAHLGSSCRLDRRSSPVRFATEDGVRGRGIAGGKCGALHRCRLIPRTADCSWDYFRF